LRSRPVVTGLRLINSPPPFRNSASDDGFALVDRTIHNCDLFEIPVPQGILDIGMKDVIRVGKDGYVDAPTKPGLGYDVDWETIGSLRCASVDGMRSETDTGIATGGWISTTTFRPRSTG
jgi:hypothetical protein